MLPPTTPAPPRISSRTIRPFPRHRPLWPFRLLGSVCGKEMGGGGVTQGCASVAASPSLSAPSISSGRKALSHPASLPARWGVPCSSLKNSESLLSQCILAVFPKVDNLDLLSNQVARCPHVGSGAQPPDLSASLRVVPRGSSLSGGAQGAGCARTAASPPCRLPPLPLHRDALPPHDWQHRLQQLVAGLLAGQGLGGEWPSGTGRR